jgi:hypothetical protein
MNFNVLAIEYIGPQDHLIGPIVISDSKKGAEWFSKAILKKTNAWDYTPEFVVNASVMKSLISEAEVHHSIAQHALDNTPEIDQIVKITLVTPRKQSKFLLDKNLAFSMLENVKGLCNNNQPLQTEILGFQNEIRP